MRTTFSLRQKQTCGPERVEPALTAAGKAQVIVSSLSATTGLKRKISRVWDCAAWCWLRVVHSILFLNFMFLQLWRFKNGKKWALFWEHSCLSTKWQFAPLHCLTRSLFSSLHLSCILKCFESCWILCHLEQRFFESSTVSEWGRFVGLRRLPVVFVVVTFMSSFICKDHSCSLLPSLPPAVSAVVAASIRRCDDSVSASAPFVYGNYDIVNV